VTAYVIVLPVTLRRYNPGIYDIIDGTGQVLGSVYGKEVAEVVVLALNAYAQTPEETPNA